jgi:hypothetical protein
MKKKKGLVERLTTQWMMELIFAGPGIGGRFTKAAFTHSGKLDVESVLWMVDFKVHSHIMLSENLGGILGGSQCYMGYCLILSEC